MEVLLAINETIYVVDSTECDDRMLQNGPFTHIAVSPNGRYVTLHTEDGKLWIITSDFQNKLNEYYSRAKTLPKDVQWCGDDGVMLAWEDEVHLIGIESNGTAAKYADLLLGTILSALTIIPGIILMDMFIYYLTLTGLE